MFSIIVPIYNKEGYLKRCLDSVVKQSISDYECILVDDGSTDASSKICAEYAERYSSIHLYKKVNGGLSDARNYGINLAKGEYILFLDADDTLHEDTLKICRKVFEKKKTDVVAFGIRASRTDRNENQETRIQEVHYRDVDLIDEILCSNIGWSVCNKAYRREVFQSLCFPIKRIFEDQFILMKILTNYSFTVIDNILYYYYQDVSDSLSKRKVYVETYDYLLAGIEILKDLDKYKQYRDKACKIVYERLVLLLTNSFYQEGQFQNCEIGKINRILYENQSRILAGLDGKEKYMLRLYLYAPLNMKKVLIRMRFRPLNYMKNKLIGRHLRSGTN